MPFTITTGGSYTSTGANKIIPLPSSADYFQTWNVTQLALTGATTSVQGEWFGSKFGVGASAAYAGMNTFKNSSNALLKTSYVPNTNNGFLYVDTYPNVEARSANAITNISAANPAVVTQTNTYNNGDVLRFYGTTGMLQIAGMDFQISSASGSGYTLLGLPATASNGFAAVATAGYTRRISTYGAVEPEFLYVTNISQATQAVVSTSVDPSLHYVVGMKMRFSIPQGFGMTQMDGLTGTIVAVNAVGAASNIGAYNVTVNIDSSAFTAFSFPASTTSPTQPLFATVAPAGASTQFNPITNVQTGYDFQYQPFRTGQFTPYMLICAGTNSPGGANADVINWAAYKFEN